MHRRRRPSVDLPSPRWRGHRRRQLSFRALDRVLRPFGPASRCVIDRVYLLDRLSLPEATPPESQGARPTAIGLDLDRLDSGDGAGSSAPTCEEWFEDYQSPYEVVPSGIDNAFQSLVGTIEGLLDAADCPGMMNAGCVDGLLAKDIARGDLLLLVELTGVDSFEHDPEVEVALHLGRTLDGAAPARGDRIGEGQTFETVRTLVPATRGDLLHGRVRVRWSQVELPRARFGYPETLLDAELRAEVCEHGLFRGVLAGATTVDALVAQTAERMPGIEDTARGLLEPIADLRPSADDPGICERISVGYAIEGIPAQRNP